jgi:ATP-dependent protease ClpP protease subunit
MIHKAYIPGLKWYQKIWMYFYSDESLDYCNSLIYGVLSARSGRSMEQVRKDLDHDNYLYCHEILLMGYADGIVPIKTKR